VRPKFYERISAIDAHGDYRGVIASTRDTVIFGMSGTTVEQKSLRIVKRKKSRLTGVVNRDSGLFKAVLIGVT
jgi:hypothetical protein